MHIRTTTREAREPLFDHHLTPESPDRIEEFVLTDDSELGRGDRRFLVLDGMVITRRRHTILRDFDLWNEQEVPTITLRFCLQGEVHARMHGTEVRTGTGRHDVLYTPDRAYVHVLRRNSIHDIVEVYLTQEYFSVLTERYPELLEAYLSHLYRHEPFRLAESGLRILPQMRSAIYQILNNHEYGPLDRVIIDANVTELLALQLRQFDQREAVTVRSEDLSRNAVEQMVEARDRVLASMGDPPTLAELARQVGTNEFSLKRNFKSVFGTTVYGLLLDHKLEHARVLILDTDRPLAEIAREVGYTHPSHFSTAFKKKYGDSPSSLRRK
jgi:AraC-like DNA-binding protein